MKVYYYYFLFCLSVSANVFTLIKDQNVTCVITGESVYSAIEVIPFTAFSRSVDNLRNWRNHFGPEWTNCSTTNCSINFDAINDQRWESFEQKCTYGTQTENGVKVQSHVQFVSFRTKKKSNIIIKCKTSESVKNVTIDVPSERWHHFSVIGLNKTIEIKLEKNESKTIECKNETDWINFSSKEDRICRKLHKYDYIYLNKSMETKTKNQWNISVDSSKCIFMYVSVDKNCFLHVTFEKNNTTVDKTIKGFNEKDTLRRWNTFNITNNIDGSGKIFFEISSNNNMSECFWAISDIQNCRDKTEFYLLDEGSNFCRTLKKQSHLNMGNAFPHNCSEISKESSSNCEKQKICLENGTCACAWGYEGSYCNETCNSGSRGLNCSQECGLNCETCNPIIGCTKCKNHRFGKQCEEIDFTSDHTTIAVDRTENPSSASTSNKYKSSLKLDATSEGVEKHVASVSNNLTRNSKNNEDSTPNHPTILVAITITFVVIITVLIIITIIIITIICRRQQIHQRQMQNQPGDDELSNTPLFDPPSNYTNEGKLRRNEKTKDFPSRNETELKCATIFKDLFRKNLSIPVTDNFQAEMKKILNEEYLEQLINYLKEITVNNNSGCFLSEEEKTKNRFRSILPGQSQVILPPSLTAGSTYINAVSVDCYNSPRRFIVTQQPLPNTIEDFWTLVEGYQIYTIVSLNHEHDAHCPVFWSSISGQPLLFNSSCQVTCLNGIDKDTYTITEVLVNGEGEKIKKIILIRIKNWDREAPTPESISVLVEIWNKIKNNPGQIVVTCFDGATASGLFVALAFVLEKIDKEHVCDVFSAVKTVTKSRFQFVQYLEQLVFLYEAALMYVLSTR